MEPAIDFSLRIRFRIPGGNRVGLDESEVALAQFQGTTIFLRADGPDSKIRDSDWLILKCSGWQSVETAAAAAEKLMDALRSALALLHLSADLGNRTPQGSFTTAGLDWMEKKTGIRALDDAHGLMVFATQPAPVFARIGPLSITQTVQGSRLREAFKAAMDSNIKLSERERSAFDIYGASHTVQNSAEARFALLFIAFETLLEGVPRPSATVAHVDSMIALTREVDLEDTEKESLLGSLRWLRNHSIRRSGRNLVQGRLAGKNYHGASAEEFFLACYDLRSRLFHGGKPFPTLDEVSREASGLDQLVGDLLAWRFQNSS